MKRVLIVDDDPNFIAVLRALLEGRGYRVQTAQDGLEALELLKQQSEQLPDIVVADVAMPRCDGLELCRRVRQDLGLDLLPFIFLSARTQPQERVAGLRLGADDYLTKPFVTEELIVRIENAIERVRRMQSEIIRATRQRASAQSLFRAGGLLPDSLAAGSPIANLSPTEQEVFQWVARGLTNQEVADQMYISRRTVQGHVASIRAKLDLPRRESIIQFAHEHSLI
ncbi:response regulator transcription factor [Leptolyngbya sp. FACHB-261]|uniref:response regulator transcription factor n=1 Tax=Leptolyngbya sp. FACHB-261 TaxID=2692806 RepID=UPI001687814C|nr:response regulator transcription factor [Leptolyngbya sp. FACHB-261]MBD2099477.1 response regulator transcription factor [Leptolyngbya sp. FACHB-261]